MALTICSLASGSSGNATYVSSGKTSILVDCGASAREITQRLALIGRHPSQLDGILISHGHSDHYRAAGTLNARFHVPVFVDPTTARALARRGRATSWRRLQETRPIPESIGEIDVTAFDTSHGYGSEEGRTVAYVLRCGAARVGVVTDLGVFTETIAHALRGATALILEANYEEAVLERKLSDPDFARDWQYLSWVRSNRGHLSNRQCAEALASVVESRATHVFLGHLSENHKDPRRDNNGHTLAFAEVVRVLSKAGTPVPQLHRTSRIGRKPNAPSVVLEI